MKRQKFKVIKSYISSHFVVWLELLNFFMAKFLVFRVVNYISVVSHDLNSSGILFIRVVFFEELELLIFDFVLKPVWLSHQIVEFTLEFVYYDGPEIRKMVKTHFEMLLGPNFKYLLVLTWKIFIKSPFFNIKYSFSFIIFSLSLSASIN